MPTTVYTPLIERKVIIDHSRPMIELLIGDLRSLEGRYSNVGEQVASLREAPARYSTLQRPVQSLTLDFARSLTVICRALETLAADTADHDHEFTVSLKSLPRQL